MLGRGGSWVGATGNVLSGNTATMFSTTGVAGQSYYNTTYNAYFDWVVDRWWPRRPDPRYGFSVGDEFFAAALPSQMDWIGSGTVNVSTGGATSPGLFQITQNSATARSALVLSAGSILLGTVDVFIEATISIPTLATPSEDFSAVFGLNDTSTYDANSACTDGAYITLNRAVNSTSWISNTTNNTTNTAKSGTATCSAAVFYRWGIYVNQGTSATFYINGSSITAAHTTNIPTGAGRNTGILFKVDKTAGTAASAMNVDSFAMWGFYNGQRTP